jgi:hypothetical protein
VGQLQRRDAVGVRRHQKRRPETRSSAAACGMHDRAGGHRDLPTTVAAFTNKGYGFPATKLSPRATRTDKPFRPTTLEKALRRRAFAKRP